MSRSEALGEQREVALPQGTIRYRERGEGEPVVFVHGVLVNGDLWRGVAPRIADAGYRAIVPDLPLGAHELPVREDADLTPPGLARLIVDFTDALGLRAPAIVANDTGGALTQIAAANHGEKLGPVVLTSCDAFEHFFPWMFKYLRLIARLPGGLSLLASAARLRPVRRAPNAFGWLMHSDPPPQVLDGWTEPLRTSAGVRRDARKVLLGVNKRHTLAAADRLRGFDRPVLIAWAADDKVFPLDDARRLESLLPDARLVTVEGSYAFVPEDQPERLAELIGGFLGDLADLQKGDHVRDEQHRERDRPAV
jgi:pimeloyl-ACP methyl ester carboxylesterase